MILSFKHRGLRRLYEDDDHRGVDAQHAERIRLILGRLDIATEPEALNLPSLRLHALKGELAGYWSVTVRANWRVIFRFEGTDVRDVDYLDYH